MWWESEQPIRVFVYGQTDDEEQAKLLADRVKHCPFIAETMFNGRDFLGAYVVPESKRWWLEIEENNADLQVLHNRQVFFSNAFATESPWSRGEVRAYKDKPPCGADCEGCGHYGVRCGGCPLSSVSRAT